MRIAVRLWLAQLAAILVVLSVGVVIRVDQEQRLMLDEVLRSRRFFAHAIQAALARDAAGPPEAPLRHARAILARDEIVEAATVVRIVSGTEAMVADDPRLGPELERALAARRILVRLVDDEIVTYVPVNQRLALELVEPHIVNELVTRIGVWAFVAQTVVLALMGGVANWVLVGLFVGRPLALLAEQARRIGAGELEARTIGPSGGIEVDVLVREMNGMAAKLETAHQALQESESERVTALEQLRHVDRLRTVGQLASSLAHELGTPLNVVSGHARIIVDDPEVSPTIRAGANVVLEEVRAMTRTLRALLDSSRHHSAHIERLDLWSLAGHAVATLEPLARKRGVKIQLEVSESTADQRCIEADSYHVMQVVTNLVMNAIEAEPTDGRVWVAVRLVNASPPDGVHGPTGEHVCLSVTDRGCGIPEADVPLLFEPFFSRKPEGEGTGLGLAVAHGIVRELKGWISVETTVGSGTRFDVFLPLATAVAD